MPEINGILFHCKFNFISKLENYILFRLERFIAEKLWTARFPRPQDTDHQEIVQKLLDHKGATFEEIFLKPGVEYCVALEIFKLFIIHVRVNTILYNVKNILKLYLAT